MRRSLYWDAFEKRIKETVTAVRSGTVPPVRRVAVFVTDRCNFRCAYCNHVQTPKTMTWELFNDICLMHGREAIIHITGGEPSMVPWLYSYLAQHGREYRFHLNTNAYIAPPAEHVRRLKVSLDSADAETWDSYVGRRGAFERVVRNIKEAIPKTVVSITYTVTRLNYRTIPDFIRFCRKNFERSRFDSRRLYAVFFSIYKGTDDRLAFSTEDAEAMFSEVVPTMEKMLGTESLALLRETMDEKRRLMQVTRFPQNADGPCYLSMSERVYGPDAQMSTCSHLYRDGIRDHAAGSVHEKCLYGCNRRLVMFNEEVASRLNEEDG